MSNGGGQRPSQDLGCGGIFVFIVCCAVAAGLLAVGHDPGATTFTTDSATSMFRLAFLIVVAGAIGAMIAISAGSRS